MSASSPINQQSVALFFTEVEEDKYGGVTVHMKEESMDAEVYVPVLRASLSRWKGQGKKSVWIKLPRRLSNLIAPTLKEGFGYHHSEPDYLMLVRWLPETPDTLSGNASHMVDIGAFVMNDKNEALVIQEKIWSFKGIDVWKTPIRIVHQGEDVFVAAIREVKEETGGSGRKRQRGPSSASCAGTTLATAMSASNPFFVSPVNLPSGDYLYYTTSGDISSGHIPLISTPLQEYIPMDATVVSADSMRQATHLLLSLKGEMVKQTGELARSLEELRRSNAVTQEENAALRRRLEEAQPQEGSEDLPDDGDESKGST